MILTPCRLASLVAFAVVGCGGSPAVIDPGGPDGAPGPASDGGVDDGGVVDDAGAAADGGAAACPSGQWCTEPAPVTGVLLSAVWAVDARDVFAVGDGGTILHRRDGRWTQLTSGTTANLRGVWAASASDAWAVGEDGTALRYDGATWTRVGALTIDLHAVFGTAADDVYLVGTGTVVHFDGKSFASRSLPGEPLAISGTSSTDLWVTGENARVSHFTGSWQTGIDPGAGSTYLGVLAVAPDDVWVSTFTPSKQTLRFDGEAWTAYPAPGTAFQRLYAVAPDDVWAAGGSKVGHFTGAAWELDAPAGATAQLWGLHGAGSKLWAVGSDALILHRE